jgi:hypothetical protein
MPNRDVIIEKSMEEILQKVQREFAEEGRQEVRVLLHCRARRRFLTSTQRWAAKHDRQRPLKLSRA